jgi:hypothetical protein
MPFSPASIASCKLWLDPTRGVGTAGGHVTTWADQQGNVSTFVNSGTGIVAGASTLSFDGSSYLESFTNLSAFISASAYWMLFVWKYTGSASQNPLPYANASLLLSQGTYWDKTISATALNNAHYDGAYKNDQVVVSGTALHYAICKYDGVKIYTSLDGAAFDAGVSAGNVGSVTDNPLLIGVSTDGAAPVAPFFRGEIGDIAGGNAAISDPDFASLVAWVQGRYFPPAGATSGDLALAIGVG